MLPTKSRMAGTPQILKTALKRLPLKTLLVLTILGLTLKENFPFSHYPMYSTFTDFTFYVYLADADGNPLPTESLTAIRTGKIKKVFDSELKPLSKQLDKRKRDLTASDKTESGLVTLRWYWDSAPPAARTKLEECRALRLYQVDILSVDGETREQPAQFIAELAIPPANPG